MLGFHFLARHYSCVSSSREKVCLSPTTRVAPGEGSLSAWMWRETKQPKARTST
jgi:ferredoxin-NADP reductase